MDFLKTLSRGCMLLLVISLDAVAAHAQDSGPTRSDSMKAATIHKFANYIQWPESANQRVAEETLSICLLGEKPFHGALHNLQKTTDTIVRQVASSSQTAGCDMLVISESEQSRLDEVLQKLHGKIVVTVSEIKSFMERGGMIQLYVKNNRIRFDINLHAAREAQLRFDLRLVRLSNVARD